MSTWEKNLDAVGLVAAILVCGVAIGLNLLEPAAITGYVSNGFVVPIFRYSLLLPLLACGLLLSAPPAVTIIVSLLLFVTPLWLALQWGEQLVFGSGWFAALILAHPVLATAMGVTAGGALLLPTQLQSRFTPAATALCGASLGLSLAIESPGDDASAWFLSAGGLGGLAMVLLAFAFTRAIRRIGADLWLPIAKRILGSWLIAASLMLSALAVAPKPTQPLPMPTLSPNVPSGSERQ